jgi:glutamine---fructose-6-phosphate transaminase (isomerizing)
VYLGRRRNTLTEERGREILQALVEVPQQMRRILGQAPYIRGVAKHLYHTPAQMERFLASGDSVLEIARTFHQHRDFLYLGRGVNYPIALEGALKLKEISYIHAEGYPAAEMKHGPIALIDPNMPVVVICTRDGSYEKIKGNVQEVRARKGKIIAVVTEGDDEIRRLSDHVLTIPESLDLLTPLLSVVPLQLLAYHIAVLRGENVDQPRNLAKAVTVE